MTFLGIFLFAMQDWGGGEGQGGGAEERLAVSGIRAIYQLLQCSVLLGHPLQILKEHAKRHHILTSTLYLCLKSAFVHRIRFGTKI